MKRLLLVLACVSLVLAPIAAQSRRLGHRIVPPGVSLTLDFTKITTQNPLLQGGLLIQANVSGGAWSNMRVSGSLAYGTQTGTSGLYDDSITLVRGPWGTDYTVTGTVHTGNQQSGNCYEELGLWVRGDIRPGSATGYENSYRMAPGSDAGRYLGTTRWNGPQGVVNVCGNGCAFDSYDPGTLGPGVNDGDVMSVSVSGAVITNKLNGSTIWTHDYTGDSGTHYTTGLPGFEHWYHNTNGSSCGTGVVSDYGFTKIVVTAP